MNWNPFRRKAKTIADVQPKQDTTSLSPPVLVHRFRTECHPEANGRIPEDGDYVYTFSFTNEDGTKIRLECGEKGFQSMSQVVMDMLTNAPSYDLANPLPPSKILYVKVKSPELLEHERKMKIVHAIWLNAYIGEKKCDSDLVIARAAKMMGIPEEHLFDGFDADYGDRAWCSRPPDWKPQDSLA